MRVDTAIIGTGPAGLSAAITLKQRNKSILLFGSQTVSAKVGKAQEIQNYLGFPSISGQELSQRFAKHIEEQEIAVTEDEIVAVYAMGSYFALQAKSGNMYEASTVILAVGISFGKPYEGEEQFLGRGVSYCATCDAPLYKGKTVVVVGSSAKEETEANFLAEMAKKVYYIPMYEEKPQLDERVEVVLDTPIAVEGSLRAQRLVCKEVSLEADGFFILRESVRPGQLVPGLEMDGNHVAVNRNLETNIKGCFACGDVVGLPYQYIKAAGEGNVAALSVVKYLSAKEVENEKK